MKTIRTIIATLSAVLLTYTLVAWFSLHQNAAYIQRTIYQGFDQSLVVALVMGVAFLLISIILTVAVLSMDRDDDDDYEEEEEEIVRPKRRPRPQAEPERRPAPQKGEQPYRRVTRNRTMESDRSSAAGEDSGFARPASAAGDRPAPKKRERAAERPEGIALRRAEAPVTQDRKARKPSTAPRQPVAPEPPEEASEMVEAPEDPVILLPTQAPSAAENETPADDGHEQLAAPSEAAPEENPAAAPAEEEAKEEEPEPAEDGEAPAQEAQEWIEIDETEAPQEQASIESVETEPAPVPAAEPREEEAAEAPAAEPRQEEDTVRCIFCGSVIKRDARFCSFCGKKR